MSAAKLSEHIPVNHSNSQSKILAERTKILSIVSRKAQEKTLTLQETNDLFAKFNETYNAKDKSNEDVDESWAITLLKECEQEEPLQSGKNKVQAINQFSTRRASNNSFENCSSRLQLQQDLQQSNKVALTDDNEFITVAKNIQELQVNPLENLSYNQPIYEFNREFHTKSRLLLSTIAGLTSIAILSIILGQNWPT